MYEVNRSVIIVIPQEPFWNWLNSLPNSDLSNISLEDLQQDANSYLIAACQNADEVWEEVDKHFGEIFAPELADWCEDESQWPDIDPDIFYNWFAIELSSIVTDLCEDELVREVF
jgi:hypothetical protein